ncbi:hypothetical protein [Zobellia russellii]|uniref:hypothetical protein n=1 Tax=Zobellia russellii TaxID=248907 RepID=UPI0037DCFBD4
MKTKFKFFMSLIMVFSIAIISCSKDGDVGPAGPQGAQGVQGVPGQDGADGVDGTDGTDGTNGQDGEDGNANVVSVMFEDKDIVVGDNPFDMSELTQEIFDTGFVLGYARNPSNTFKWESLPIVISNEVRMDIDEIRVGGLIVHSIFNQTLSFRFILVEGNLSGKTGSENLKKMTYEEVIQYFGLEY